MYSTNQEIRMLWSVHFSFLIRSIMSCTSVAEFDFRDLNVKYLSELISEVFRAY